MATYRIPGPDGKNYEITGPEGASQEEIIDEVMRQHFGREPKRYKDTTPEQFAAENAPAANRFERLREYGSGVTWGLSDEMEAGVRAAFGTAVSAATERSRELG